ncbi:hypothetical protein WICPIJ_004096 [Wickerhamomyces pijperi]|uniref:Uncharacterized protein n=1 Tax=Wickerhamomyces pijperi TaxID=599730 RepID=A0A9P8Q6B3_WICPI|nr:hypothetical protein WICPIJ_004096 [Wickerhamomyces pijperi]
MYDGDISRPPPTPEVLSDHSKSKGFATSSISSFLQMNDIGKKTVATSLNLSPECLATAWEAIPAVCLERVVEGVDSEPKYRVCIFLEYLTTDCIEETRAT